MTSGSYRADGRDTAAVIAELAAIAKDSRLPGSLAEKDLDTWHELLFGTDENDALLKDPSEPSSSLLDALARVHAGLIDHFDTLPAAARRYLMEQRYGIRALPLVPDRVVLKVDGDPKRPGSVLPKGSRVKAGTNAFGSERLYETVEELAVLAGSVLGARTHLSPDPNGATDVIASYPAPLDALTTTFAAFGDPADLAAPHELLVASDLLWLTSGHATITLRFDGPEIAGVTPTDAARVRDVLTGLTWMISTPQPDGWSKLGRPAATIGPQGRVTLGFSFAGPTAMTAFPAGSAYCLRGSFPDSASVSFRRDDAFRLRFTSVRLQVEVVDARPDNGFFNDGLIDVSKEFKPFGPVPQSGDSFGLRLDSAFSKPLADLTITLEEVVVDEASLPVHDIQPEKHTPGQHVFPVWPLLSWQRLAAGVWEQFATDTFPEAKFRSLGNPTMSPLSARAALGGIEGHSIRAVLNDQDFGWDIYLQTLADNVTRFATPANPPISVTPPKPPRVGGVTLSYTTAEADLVLWPRWASVAARNALSSTATLAAPFEPFARRPSGRSGTLYIGLDGIPLGEVAALYVELEEHSACSYPGGVAEVFWEYCSPRGWIALAVVDHTAGLRQSGIVRFVAPTDWATGSAEVGEAQGLWLRVSTGAPEIAGRVRAVRLNAVEADYVPAPGHERDDPTPATPLPAGAVSALKAAVPGVRLVANPGPSAGGRGPEPAGAFFARSGQILRHRNRAVTPWDVESLVQAEFPEVALVRCLPHHSYDEECVPGWFAVVVVPRSTERRPAPSIGLAGRIETFLHEHATLGTWHGTESQIAVLCACYEEVSVAATIQLVRGVSSGEARTAIETDLRGFLHPLLGPPERSEFGRPFFLSSVVAFLERHASVDYVVQCAFTGDHAGDERIDVNGCCGLVTSAAEHSLVVKAAL